MENITLKTFEDSVLSYGLERAGFRQYLIQKTNKAAQAERFVSFYGVSHRTCAASFDALRKIRADAGVVSHLLYFLVTMFWFKSYVTESVLAGVFQITENTVRKWIWEYARSLQLLKASKVRIIKTKD